MVLRSIIAILMCIWLFLVLIGKGGLVHIILLTAIGVSAVEVMIVYRRRMTA